jgi:hypothetical protein
MTQVRIYLILSHHTVNKTLYTYFMFLIDSVFRNENEYDMESGAYRGTGSKRGTWGVIPLNIKKL